MGRKVSFVFVMFNLCPNQLPFYLRLRNIKSRAWAFISFKWVSA